MRREEQLLSLHNEIFQLNNSLQRGQMQAFLANTKHFLNFDLAIACNRDAENKLTPFKMLPDHSPAGKSILNLFNTNGHFNSILDKHVPVFIDSGEISDKELCPKDGICTLAAIPFQYRGIGESCLVLMWQGKSVLSKDERFFVENLTAFLNRCESNLNGSAPSAGVIKKIGRDLHLDIYDDRKLIQNIVLNAATFTGAEHCCLVLYDENERKLRCAYGNHCQLFKSEAMETCSFVPSEKKRLVCEVFRKGRSRIIKNIDTEGFKSNTRDKAGQAIKSQLAVPLRKSEGSRNDNTIGVLVLEHSKPDFFRVSDLELARALGEVSVYVLKNSELFKKNNKMIEKLELLSAVSNILLSEFEAYSLDYKFDHIVSQATQILDAELCSLWIAENDHVTLKSSFRNLDGIIEKGPKIGLRLPIEENAGLTEHVAHTKQLQNLYGEALRHFPAIQNKDASDFLSTKTRQSVLCHPMLDNNNELIGILIAYNKKDDKGRIINYAGFSDDLDLPLMKILTTKLVISIKNTRLVNELSATIDNLKNYESIIESSTDLAMITGQYGRIQYMNKGAIELLGNKIGRRITECFFSDEFSSALGKVKENTQKLRSARDNTFSNRETMVLGKNGESIPVSLSASFIRDKNDKVIGSVGFAKDLRDIKTLFQLGKHLMSLTDVDQILQTVTSECLNKLPKCSRAYAKLYDEKTNTLLYKALSSRRPGEKLPVEPSPVNRGITGVVFQRQTYYISGNVSKDSSQKHYPLFPAVNSTIAIPLTITDRNTQSNKTIAILNIDSEEFDAFTANNLYMLSTIANQAAAAIANAQLIQRQNNVIKELSAIQAVEERITTTLDIDKIKEVVLEVVKNTLGFDMVTISEVNRTTNIIGTTMGLGVSSEFLDLAWHSLQSDDIQAWVVKNKQEVILYGWDDRLDRQIYERFNHEQYVRVILPIIVRDEVLATLEAGYEKIHKKEIDEDELAILRKVANLAGIGISQANLVKEQENNLNRLQEEFDLQRELENQLQALFQASIDIQSCKTESEACQFVFNSLKSIGYTKSMISIINRHDEKIEGRWAMGESWMRIKDITKRALNGRDILALAVKKKHPLLSKECATDPRCNHKAIELGAIRSQYVIPLVVRDESIGTIQIDLTDKPELVFGDEHVFKRRMRVIETFVNQAAIAIGNIRDTVRIADLETKLAEFPHEILSPLHNIHAQIGGLQELIENKNRNAKEIDEKKIEEFVNIIFEEIERAKRQMDNTRMLSKKARSNIGYNFEYENLGSIVYKCVNSYRVRAIERDISIAVRDNIRRLPCFYFDPHKISQVCSNLIDNAVKYSRANTYIQIDGFDDGTNIKFSIRNRGVGIKEEDYDKIFTSFSRTPIDDTRQYIPGTGIGLKIAKEIVEGHGGTIKVKSVPVGTDKHHHSKYSELYDTIFTVSLPKKAKGKSYGM
ncbi:GAF domain-containing protein [candidate division KSB1 bacterium]|nr:GAF domain-containing protein [candidate division KSB1 bacterium]